MKAKLQITIEGNLVNFLGVSIECKKDGTIHMTQPQLKEQILQDLRMTDESMMPRSTPASPLKVLTQHTGSPEFDGSFNYRTLFGKLNYLAKAIRSDIAIVRGPPMRSFCFGSKEGTWQGRTLAGTLIEWYKEQGHNVKTDAQTRSRSLCGCKHLWKLVPGQGGSR